MEICINCGLESTGNYCPTCGQHLLVKNVSLKSISSEITDRWLGLDTKFARTVKDLTVRPAVVFQQFLDRNTVRYIGPLGYFIVVSALMILFIDVFDLQVQDFLKETNKGFGGEVSSEKQRVLQDQIFQTFSSYFRFIGVLVVPFSAFGIFLLFGRRKNYFENFVIALYSQSHNLWLTILSIGFFSYLAIDLTKFLLFVNLGYFTWALGSFYRKMTRFSYLKAAVAWFIGFLLFLLFTMLIGIAIVLLFYRDS